MMTPARPHYNEEELGDRLSEKIENEFKKTSHNKLIEEFFKTAVSVIAIIGFIWFVGEPHLARYVDNRIKLVDPATNIEIEGIKLRLNQLTEETEVDQKTVVNILARLDAISQNTRDMRDDIQRILRTLPQKEEDVKPVPNIKDTGRIR